MEAVGQLIVSLHRNIEEIRASLDTNGGKSQSTAEAALLQSTIDRAEAALRAQARQFVAAVAENGGDGAGGFSGVPPQKLPPHQSRRFLSTPPSGLPRPSPPFEKHWPETQAHLRSNPDLRQRPLRAPSAGSRVRSKTTRANRLLPKGNRLDPLADPPMLTEDDLQAGLQSLASRGFIPMAADVTPAMERGMPVIMQKPAPLYDKSLKHERREIAPADVMSQVRLDTSAPPRFASSADITVDSGALVPYQSASPQLPPLQQLASSLPALPAPPPVPTQVLARESTGIAENFGTFCTELLDTAPGSPGGGYESLPPPRAVSPGSVAVQRVSMTQIKAAHATTISSAFRGFRQRRKYEQMRVLDQSARKLQRAWTSAMTRMRTKLELQRRREDDRKLHTRLMYELGQDWFQAKQLRRVEVHVCSLTIPEDRRKRMEGFQALQARQVCRIFRLMESKRDVIFVAPKFLHEDILDYYAKIMQFRGIKNPPGRFQIVVPENAEMTPYISLTQALLCSPKALKRVRKLVKGRQSVIVPEVVTHAEVNLCSQLQLPLMGPGPRNMALLSSKSNAKKLCQLADLPIGPWAVDIYDEDEFFSSLAALVVQNPQLRTWLFKIDDERDSRGHAYIDLQKMREVVDALRASVHQNSRQSFPEDEPAVDTSEVRQLLQRHVPRRAVVCNRIVYPDFAAWMSEACRKGAVIQAVPEGIMSQTSVHIHIDPDGTVNILGTTEAVMCTPFVRAASWYPHTRGSWEVLHEVGIRSGRVLAAKGLVGYASVDVVFHDNPDFDPAKLVQASREPTPMVIGGDTPVNPRDLMFGNLRSPSPAMATQSDGGGQSYPSVSPQPPSLPESRQADYELAVQLQEIDEQQRSQWDQVSLLLGSAGQVGASPASRYACWAVDVDARLTDEAAALWPVQFVAQVRQDASTGILRLTSDAPLPEGSAQMSEEEIVEKSQRWALISHVSHVPGLDRMNYQSLFQAAKMKGVSFDLFNNVGCVFTFLDVFHSFFSLLSVDRTAENCAKRLATAVGVLAEGPNGGRGVGTTRARHSASQTMSHPVSALEVQDGITVTDVQMALRTTLRRWSEKMRQSTSVL
eukprot:TRINITY_DN20688_c1_g1_i1.p1 TRINITY_DN20688_c1_g1~~TRINITY_DN20688_c1_g1_i1.p1  ORF type:complete len:1126 (-),score=186.14 TRINITY_DN20688_c1_g1_i1:37-3306(-)